MSNLKELTKEVHREAENTLFAQKLANGNISVIEYYIYLLNQSEIYQNLERRVDTFGMDDIRRTGSIIADINELRSSYNLTDPSLQDWNRDWLCEVVEEYTEHLTTLDQLGLCAHLYVRHFGDMYGGQIIKKHVPGSGSMYDFRNARVLKEKVRDRLDDTMSDEAVKCFRFAIKLFRQLDHMFLSLDQNKLFSYSNKNWR